MSLRKSSLGQTPQLEKTIKMRLAAVDTVRRNKHTNKTTQKTVCPNWKLLRPVGETRHRLRHLTWLSLSSSDWRVKAESTSCSHQLRTTAEFSMEIWNKWDQDPPAFLPVILTGSEQWLYHHDPEDQAEQKQWLPGGGGDTVIAGVAKSKCPANAFLEFSRHSPGGTLEDQRRLNTCFLFLQLRFF